MILIVKSEYSVAFDEIVIEGSPNEWSFFSRKMGPSNDDAPGSDDGHRVRMPRVPSIPQLHELPCDLIIAICSFMDPSQVLALTSTCSKLALRHMILKARREAVMRSVRERLKLTDDQARCCRTTFVRFALGSPGVLCHSSRLPEMISAYFHASPLEPCELQAVLRCQELKHSTFVTIEDFHAAVTRASAAIHFRAALPLQTRVAQRELFMTCAGLTPTELDGGDVPGRETTVFDYFQVLCSQAIREGPRRARELRCGLWSDPILVE